jgi:hypothetical protein
MTMNYRIADCFGFTLFAGFTVSGARWRFQKERTHGFFPSRWLFAG